MLDKVLFGADQLESLVANLIRIGEVTSINPEAFTARVRFEDRDNVESYDLRILVRGSLRDKFFHMPDVGENVLCLFLPSGVEAGFILGAYYPAPLDRPAASEDITAVQYEDGTRIEYDRESKKLQIDIPENTGEIVINCAGPVTVNSPKIDLGEEADLEPSVLGDKLAAAFQVLKDELDNHQHIGNLGVPTSAAAAVRPITFAELLSGGNVYSKKNRNQ